MIVVAYVFTALAALIACGNISGCVAAYRRRKHGSQKEYSNIPLLSLVFALVGWLLGREQIGLWPFLAAAVDPGTWMTLYLPWVIWKEFIKKR